MRILCIGDVFGKPGRQALKGLVPSLVDRHGLDLVIANVENASGGIGLTVDTAKELLAGPLDLMTTGNHIWKHKEILPLLEKEPRIIRPLNYPAGTPGRGYTILETAGRDRVAVINLEGRIFMNPIGCPFACAEEVIAPLRNQTKIILVEIHAEATSEKRALGWFLDGKVSAVYGTHTHVLTADEEILPGGTGYISDLGMTGPYDSVIGMRKEEVIEHFLTMRPTSFTAAKRNIRLCGAIFDIDQETGRTRSVERVNEPLGTA
jgi:2',3'-cyclic-nucleotide 2'-phosphodiesterase